MYVDSRYCDSTGGSHSEEDTLMASRSTGQDKSIPDPRNTGNSRGVDGGRKLPSYF